MKATDPVIVSFRMKLVAQILSCWLFVSSVFSHDLWLVAKHYRVPSGQKISFFAINGSTFPVSEAPVRADRLQELFVADPEGKKIPIEPGATRVENKSTVFDFTFPGPGNYWAVMATKPRLIELEAKKFNEYLEHDGLAHVLEARRKKGIAGRGEVEQYSKYAKSYVLIGDQPGANFSHPLGLKIEIVPQKNPYSLRTGEELPVQVLFENRPLAGFLVQTGFAGMKSKGPEAYTDAQGRAGIRISNPGHWYLRGIHMVETEGEKFRYESFWASLTFAVR